MELCFFYDLNNVLDQNCFCMFYNIIDKEIDQKYQKLTDEL